MTRDWWLGYIDWPLSTAVPIGCTCPFPGTTFSINASAPALAARQGAAMVRIIPRETKFFDLFAEVASNVTDGARLLTSILEDFDNIEVRVNELREIEHKGDDLTHSIMTKLNQTFITPFDREDIHRFSAAHERGDERLVELGHDRV